METRRSLLVPHSAQRMFDLIEAAEHYPRFLPWCSEAKIVARDDAVVVADITVDYHGVKFRFTTRNPKRRPEWMAITLERGPFRRFEGEWNLKQLGDEGSHIEFTLRYDFESGVMRTLAGPVFERITNTLVDAFVTRADIVYAGLPPDVPPAPTPAEAEPPSTMFTPAQTSAAAMPASSDARAASPMQGAQPDAPTSDVPASMDSRVGTAPGAPDAPAGIPPGSAAASSQE